jgi:hypothetical protein
MSYSACQTGHVRPFRFDRAMFCTLFHPAFLAISGGKACVCSLSFSMHSAYGNLSWVAERSFSLAHASPLPNTQRMHVYTCSLNSAVAAEPAGHISVEMLYTLPRLFLSVLCLFTQ